MLYYSIAEKATKKILESGFRSPFNEADFKAAIVANYGGIPGDYVVYTLDENDSRAKRIKSGDEHSLTWTGAGSSADIVDVDFTVEDSKRFIQFTSDKSAIMADGIDLATISAMVLKPDKSPDNSFTGKLDIPCMSPVGKIKMRFAFSAGLATRAIQSETPGEWIIPIGKINGMRADNEVKFDSVY